KTNNLISEHRTPEQHNGKMKHLLVTHDNHSARNSRARRISLMSQSAAIITEDVGALSNRVRVKELESSKRDINAIEAGKEPGKNDKLVTLEQRDLVVTEIRFERGQRSKRTESMERGVMSETSGSRKSNRVDGGPTIGIPDKCKNRLDSYNKIVPIDTIELIKKKEGLGVDNGPVRYHNDDDNTILAKQDIHPSERNGVMLIPTGDIMIASCDNPGECSKKENGELVINGMRYWNTDELTMMRPKANRVGLRYHDEGWITIYEWDAHPPESKTEYETEGGMMFVSTWEPWDPEDSRNDNVTKEESTNDDELADQDHWEEVVLIPTSVVTIENMIKIQNWELVSSGARHGDMDELTGGRSDVNGVGLEYHDDKGMVTDDPPDRNKVEWKMKEGPVVVSIWEPGVPGDKAWQRWVNMHLREVIEKLEVACYNFVAKIVHCAMMITIMTILMSNKTIPKSESAGIV
ncbi:396_t:CDS:2, partial [Acaulospora morrowiae]